MSVAVLDRPVAGGRSNGRSWGRSRGNVSRPRSPSWPATSPRPSAGSWPWWPNSTGGKPGGTGSAVRARTGLRGTAGSSCGRLGRRYGSPALEDLPLTRDAFAAGRLSYSKVRALTRVANAENEAELVDIGLGATAVHVERIVRTYRRVLSYEQTVAELGTVNARHRAGTSAGTGPTMAVS